MATKRVQVQKKQEPTRTKADHPHPLPATDPPIRERAKRLQKSMDKVIDAIDDVLEKNAGEFVRNYRQRSGE